MEISLKFVSIFMFSFFLVFNHDFVIYITHQTHQLMTSQIRSHIEYLIQTYKFLVLIL